MKDFKYKEILDELYSAFRHAGNACEIASKEVDRINKNGNYVSVSYDIHSLVSGIHSQISNANNMIRYIRDKEKEE